MAATKEDKAKEILEDSKIDPNQVGESRALEEKKVEEKVDALSNPPAEPDVKKTKEPVVEAISKDQASPDRITPKDKPRYLQAQKVFIEHETAPSFDFDGSRWRPRDDGQSIIFELVGSLSQ